MFILEELKFITLELKKKKDKLEKIHKCELLASTQATLKSAVSESFLNQGTKHSQPAFEEA